MRFPRHLKQATKRALSVLNALMVIASLLLSPVAHALQVKLGSAMNLRVLKSGSLALRGTLAAGSIVEIPDKYRVTDRKTGKVNGLASFNNWLDKAGFTQGEINKKVVDPKLDFYFPVKVISMAKGSRGPRSLIGKTQFMALRVLARSSGKLKVKTNAPVYAGPADDEPLWPQASAERNDETPALAPAPAEETAPVADPQLEATGPCENCETPAVDTQVPESASDLAETAETIESSYLPQTFDAEAASHNFQGLTSSFKNQCNAFIKPDGGYGSTGRIILSEISKNERYLNDENGAVAACPRFKQMTDAEKRHFWVWAFASLAYQEATCDPNARAPIHVNKNGHAAGYFQIEERVDLRKSRDRKYGGRFCQGDPYNITVNTRCAVRMLSSILDGRGPYSKSGNYWSSFLNPGTKAKKRIAQYKACHTGAAK